MKKRYITVTACLVLLTVVFSTSPGTAYAAQAGDLTITNGTVNVDYSLTGNTIHILSGKAMTISGSTTRNTISVAAGKTANLTFSNLSITSVAEYAVANAGTMNVTLAGTTTLRCSTSSAYAAFYTTGSLTIGGSGTLNATGSLGSAGMGASYRNDSPTGFGTIAIKSGTINAYGYNTGVISCGAGIGGCWKGSGGTINISGGTVNGRSSSLTGCAGYGSGIGSGYQGTGTTTVNITGGSVVGTSSSYYGYGAGIGSGREANGTMNVAISGGVVTGRSSLQTTYSMGAAIGSGMSGRANQVRITGGTVTTSYVQGSQAASLGAGKNGACSSVTIDGGSLSQTLSASAVPTINPAPRNSSGAVVALLSATIKRGVANMGNTVLRGGDLAGIRLVTAPNGASGQYGINGVQTTTAGVVNFYVNKQAMIAGNRGYITPNGTTALVSKEALSAVSVATFSDPAQFRTVRFHTNGGTPIPSPITDVIVGNKIARPSNPKSSKTLLGWSLQTAPTSTLWNFGASTVSSDMTLNALWLGKPKIAKTKVIGANHVSVKWKAVTGATHYQVWYKTPKGKWKAAKLTKNKSIKIKKIIKKSGTYRFKMRSVRKVNGKTVYSSFSPVKKLKLKVYWR